MWLVLFYVYTLWEGAASMELPEYIKSCSRNDPNLNDCALNSAKASIQMFAQGDSSRDLLPLDPLYVKDITVYIPNENGLKLIFKDNYFHGLSNMELRKLKFDLNKKLISVEALVNLDVKNQYELSGKFLVIPIKSDGDSSIKLKNTVINLRIWYEHVTLDDGLVHWNITKHDIKYEAERAMFHLDNLLGDKNIGDQINRLINELWREIVADVGPHISASLLNAIVTNLKVLLHQVPYDVLMPE